MYWDGVNPFRMLTKDPAMFWNFYPEALFRMAYLKIKGEKLRNNIYGGHKVYTQDEANEFLTEALHKSDPFFFCRHGTNEVQIAIHAQMKTEGITDKAIVNDTQFHQCEHCGLFPCDDETSEKFNKLIIESTENCDIYGALWLVGESYYIQKYLTQQAKVTHTNCMDFWRYSKPFTCALKGKKVLVIHPLAGQIEKQYQKREKLFKDPDWLPEFELHTITAVQTIAGERDERFSSWFEALDYMYEQTKLIDYDVALLGCGAYGNPLASMLKKDGKQVIYMGGVLQMLFGIRGKRWDDIPEVKTLYNEYWVDPDPSLRPLKAKSVEGGCYW